METTFNVVKPNLYLVDDAIYFGINEPSDIILASQSIDKIIEKHIGELKVKESDIEVIKSEKKKKTSEKYLAPLNKYIESLKESYEHLLSNSLGAITGESMNLFNLSYIIRSQTVDDIQEIKNWIKYKEVLENPKKSFDKFDKENFYIVDRKKTFGKIKTEYQKLDKKIPENTGMFVVIPGQFFIKPNLTESKYLGFIALEKLKAKDKTKIEKTKSELVEKLKEIEGPCLSFDVPTLFKQARDLAHNAQMLITNFGDILVDPNWQTKFFRFDP